ncbi:WXG100 family type VII secretion target [Nocardia anaemiae]|uniref:WXG100 family type VII secretion target n=1 Tax=Nocardia anaemiae TaxID=263910 RepID=UPI0007A3E8F8|nr:WXG100 family type VII secretion target [Nocardia anaemiae]
MSNDSASSAALEVIPEEVKEVGRFAYRVATELRSGSSSLDVEVQSVLSTWRGIAADAYGSGWEELRRGASEVWEALFELAEKLGITAETYQTADSARASTFSSLDL